MKKRNKKKRVILIAQNTEREIKGLKVQIKDIDNIKRIIGGHARGQDHLIDTGGEDGRYYWMKSETDLLIINEIPFDKN